MATGRSAKSFLWKHKKAIGFSFGVLFLVLVVAVVICDKVVSWKVSGLLYDNVDSIPKNRVGMLLGTSKHFEGNINPYFKYRIEAASLLYHAGKIERVIVSGDNSTMQYNEAEDMRKALIADSVPDSCIYLDYAGFRTFDSMIRGREIFGQTKFTVISQRFHNERAVFIGRHEGLDVIGFDAEDVGGAKGFKTVLREYLARVKLFLDLYILNTKPKFLGEKVEIK